MGVRESLAADLWFSWVSTHNGGVWVYVCEGMLGPVRGGWGQTKIWNSKKRIFFLSRWEIQNENHFHFLVYFVKTRTKQRRNRAQEIQKTELYRTVTEQNRTAYMKRRQTKQTFWGGRRNQRNRNKRYKQNNQPGQQKKQTPYNTRFTVINKNL